MPRVSHHNKHKLIKLCQRKEAQGYECVKPIRKVFVPQKFYDRRNGRAEFKDVEYNTYYEAVYEWTTH